MLDYYAGGSLLPGRYSGGNSYRYGYQGSEKDDEISGVEGAHITTFFREFDTRLVRTWSVDPVFQPWQSPYTSMDNNPIWFNDPLGNVAGDYYNEEGEHLGSDGVDDNKVYVAESVTKNKDGLVTDAQNSTELGVTHTEFATSANVVKHESSGNKEESLWIAHTANNAKDNNAIDYKKQNTTLNDQLTDQNYSTTPASARTALSVSDASQSANNARAAVIDVHMGGADPTGGAVLWDGDDFLRKGTSHNKFKEYSNISISSTILQKYGLGPSRPGKSIASTFVKELVLKMNYSEKGKGKYYSIEATGAPGKGRSIFWKLAPK